MAFAAVPAAAQQSGGEALAPEVLNTPGAAEILRERAFARVQSLQSLQALRAAGSSSLGFPGAAPAAAAPSDPNGGDPLRLERSAVNQEAVARIPSRGGDPGFLAGFTAGQARAASRIRAPSFAGDAFGEPVVVNQSQTLVVNAQGSPVSIGNNNIVQQQVANSTAISTGGGAPASATSSLINSGQPPAAPLQPSAGGSTLIIGGVPIPTTR